MKSAPMLIALAVVVAAACAPRPEEKTETPAPEAAQVSAALHEKASEQGVVRVIARLNAPAGPGLGDVAPAAAMAELEARGVASISPVTDAGLIAAA